jgi:cytochrome c peroxidase
MLRRIADTRPYAHNGYFRSLWGIVYFYNTRDVKNWPDPEVAENVNADELGKLGLKFIGEVALVSFMRTLTDGRNP